MNTKKILQFTLFLLLTVALVWLSFRAVDFKTFVDALRNANYYWVAASALIGVVAYFIRARRWTLLLEPLGYAPRLAQMYDAVMVGYIANLAFPRLGEVMRCGALAKSNKVPFDKLVGTVVVERTFDTLCMLLLIVFTFFFRIDTFGKFVQDKVFTQVSGTRMLLLAAAALVALAALIVLVWRFRVRLRKYGFVQKIFSFARGILSGLKTFVTMRRRAEFVLQTVLLWACYWLMAWVALFALPDTSDFGPADGLAVMLLGSFGMVVPVNGGIGAYHFITSLGLTYIYGITTSAGMAYATLTHESQLLLLLVLGTISVVRVFIIPHKQQQPVGKPAGC